MRLQAPEDSGAFMRIFRRFHAHIQAPALKRILNIKTIVLLSAHFESYQIVAF